MSERLALLAAAVLLVAKPWIALDTGRAVDFYQFWAVGAARSLEPGLPSPWSDPDAYREPLSRSLEDASDEARRVHRFRMRELELFGSPLLYWSFAALPADYEAALAGYRGLQLLALCVAIVVLCRRLGFGRSSWLAPGLLLAGYRPLGDDLYAGNLNVLQLAALVAALELAWRLRLAPEARRPLLAAALVTGLGGLLLLKPNLLLAGVGLGLALRSRLTGGEALRALALALPALALLAWAPMRYFGSAAVWGEWLGRVFVAEPERLAAYAVLAGNTSAARWLEESLGLPALLASGGLALLLGASLLRAPGAFRDPDRAAALGAIGMLALAPLVWFHYWVLALPAFLWLLRASGPPRWLAGAGGLLVSGVYLPLLPREFLPVVRSLWCFAWALPWVALLLTVRSRGRVARPGAPACDGTDRRSAR